MRFGKTLQTQIYPPWRAHYIDYNRLKQLLREGMDDGDSGSEDPSTQPEWTENDEQTFCHELINVQLDKVHNFQKDMTKGLNERTEKCEQRLEKLVKGEEEVEDKDEILKTTLNELDEITKDINELERFSRINFTGFLKAAKKHDRRSRGAKGSKKGKGTVADPKVKPLLQVRFSQMEFNKEDYSPLLYRLSTMYDFVRRSLGEDQAEGLEQSSSANAGSSPTNKKYTSHKFWVHQDNIIEVKTFVLRRLPVLVYNAQPSKELDTVNQDPTVTSLYFDNSKFQLYTDKVLKEKDASSLRLRWYGQLSQANEIHLERKTISGGGDSEGAVEERISLKKKYVNDFLLGKYSMEKTVQKMQSRNIPAAEIEEYQTTVANLQKFILENDLQPVLRASYNRTAFQIPGDDRIRISLDTDLALIREDALDSDRPCRDPDNWHRTDIDENKMEHPFNNLKKGEISRFPYALLEIKIRERELHSRTRDWIEELMSSHLVHAAPRFSKFAHGVAVLFDDHVNSFPFWLGEMDDIRKDPRKAWDAEQERKKKQIEDETAVGSFRPSVRDFGGRGSISHSTPPPSSGVDAGEGRSRFSKKPLAGAASAAPQMLPSDQVAEVEDESNHESSLDQQPGSSKANTSTLDGLRQLFPSFSSSRYGRAHSGRRPVALPAGVQKPTQLIMYSGEVKVEAKVWLANQRTFIKWMHMVVLLASLGVAIYNGASPGNTLAKSISLVYTGIAIFAGIWGYAVYIWRSNLIRQRSGRDFDSVFGPLVVCIALAVALIANFGFKYHAMMEKSGNVTVSYAIGDEL